MQIIFESRDAEGIQMREFSVERVGFTFRRLIGLVPLAKAGFRPRVPISRTSSLIQAQVNP